MKLKKILIIRSHPKVDSFSNVLADKYASGAKKSGNRVKNLDLRELRLEDFLKFDYKSKPVLTDDLLNAQKLISWADHLVFVYPIWWATPPALLKVFLEVILQSGFAFKYGESKSFIPKIDKLLSRKSARLIATMDSPPLYYTWILRDPAYKMMKANLNFCGVKPVFKSYFGSVKMASDEKKQKWLREIYEVGKNE